MIETFIVDAFTDKAFKGNPAGVCLLNTDMGSNSMLLIAQELGLSETAFIKKLEENSDNNNMFSIRYFSPKTEIPLCGHATLAASKVIFETTNLQEIHFYNIQNIDLHIRKQSTEIFMEFPVYATTPAEAPLALLKALGIDYVVNTEDNKETNILLLEIDDVAVLQKLQPDFVSMLNSITTINGVVVTAPSKNDSFDFHSRYFWPWSGTNEDPVTGGTHTFLTPYWSKRLGKTKMKSFQSSLRTGTMEVNLLSDNKFTIKSNAVIVFQGHLRI